MIRRLALCLLVIVAPGLGCSPALSDLLRDRHYQEALCLANEADAATEARVLVAIMADARPALHLLAVSEVELIALVGDQARALLDQVAVVRVRTDAHRLDVDGFSLLVGLGRAGARLADIPIARENLAVLTGEALPQPRRVTVAGTRRPAQHGPVGALVLPLAFVWDLGTFFSTGATKAAYDWQFPKNPDRTYTRDPTPAEYARLAPAAESLYQALRPRQCPDPPGSQCDQFIILPRSDAAEADHIWVQVYFWGEWLDDRGQGRGINCRVRSPVLEGALPPGPDLVGRLRALFGQRMRALDELALVPLAEPPPFAEGVD